MLALVMVLWMKVVFVCLCVIVCILILLVRSKTDNEEEKQFDFYLAGAMRGYEDKNKAMFLKVATLLREQGHIIFNPGEINDDGMSFSECMVVDLDAVINRCEGIVFLPDWKNSLGANTEALVAAVCGKEAYQVRLIKKGTQVKLREISLAKRTLPYKVKRRS